MAALRVRGMLPRTPRCARGLVPWRQRRRGWWLLPPHGAAPPVCRGKRLAAAGRLWEEMKREGVGL